MNERRRPTEQERKILLANREYYCWKAAQVIKESDYFLLSIGAGFSADSGLPTFTNIADVPAYKKAGYTYPRLCDPSHFIENPELAFGFWGKTYNDYITTTPHEGHQIIMNWRNEHYNYPPEDRRFFIYSSNIDGHPQKCGFSESEIFEIHGTMHYWQCSEGTDCPGMGVDSAERWKVPEGFLFEIDEETMLAAPEKQAVNEQLEQEQNEVLREAFKSNHPRCILCKQHYARPNVLMFYDCDWVGNYVAKKNYTKWVNKMEKNCDSEKGEKKIVILEIGCGTNVPSVRCRDEGNLRVYIESLLFLLIILS